MCALFLSWYTDKVSVLLVKGQVHGMHIRTCLRVHVHARESCVENYYISNSEKKKWKCDFFLADDQLNEDTCDFSHNSSTVGRSKYLKLCEPSKEQL